MRYKVRRNSRLLPGLSYLIILSWGSFLCRDLSASESRQEEAYPEKCELDPEPSFRLMNADQSRSHKTVPRIVFFRTFRGRAASLPGRLSANETQTLWGRETSNPVAFARTFDS
jgi:hypothetical protein